MKKIYGLIAGMALTASCAHEKSIYEMDFRQIVPVTSRIIKVDYKVDDNGTNYEIRIQDKPTSRTYKLVRDVQDRKLNLEEITEYAQIE